MALNGSTTTTCTWLVWIDCEYGTMLDGVEPHHKYLKQKPEDYA